MSTEIMDRCDWSDLPVETCGHCLGHAAMPLDPTPAEPPRPTGRVIWSETMSRAAEDRPSRPSKARTGQSSTSVIRGPQSGQNECACGKPTRDNATLCDDCTETMEKALGDVAWIDDEIDVSLTRQKAVSLDGGAPSAQQGIPWHDKAAQAKRNLHGYLVSWVRLCNEEGVGNGPVELPADNPKALAAWLLHRVPGLARHDAAEDALTEITDAVAECERIIFWKRKSRTYLGTCGQRVEDQDGTTLLERCPGEVYADEGASVGWCDDCDQGVTVVIRQGELNKELDDRLYTAAELARLAVILGLDAKRDSVRKKILYWHRHKRIAQRSTTVTGDPMFRYGEVRVMLYAEFRRDTA